MENNAFDAFYASLKEALRSFGDWDGIADYSVLFQRRIGLHFSLEELQPDTPYSVHLPKRGLPDASLPQWSISRMLPDSKIVADTYIREALLRSITPAAPKTMEQ